jgi:solute carrier family 50 protein (sugar transporter)
MILGNCTAWVAYGLYISNPYIFWSNAPGVLVGLFMFSSGIQLGSSIQRDLLERLAIAMGSTLLLTGYAISMVLETRSECETLGIIVANAFTLAFFGSPLSTLGAVLATRNASSINGMAI